MFVTWNRTRRALEAVSVLAFAGLIAVGLLPGAATAATVNRQTDQKCYEYKNPTDWGGVQQSLAVDRFNVTGGTLTAVSVTRTVNIVSKYTANSQNMGTRTVNIAADGSVAMNGNYGLRNLSATFNEAKSYTYTNGVGTSSDTVADKTDTDSQRLTSSSDLSSWSGGGTNTFTGVSNANSSVIGSGNNGAQINTDALMRVCVTYEYTENVTVCIGDYVWVDKNHNGIQDQGEQSVPGMTVTITGANGTTLGTAVTDANGRWQVCGLEPNMVCTGTVTLPSGYLVTLAQQGADRGTDSNGVSAGTGASFACQTPASGSDLTYDVGIWSAPQPFAPAVPGSSNAPASTVIRTAKSTMNKLIASGGRAVFTVTVSNTSTTNLTNVTVCDRPPAQLSFVTRPAGSFFRSGSLCWKVASLPAGAKRAFRYTMKASRVASRTCVNNIASAADGQGGVASARAGLCIKPAKVKALQLAG